MEGRTIADNFKRYYDRLTSEGFVSREDVCRLIVAKWIYDFTNFKYGIEISKEDYEKVNNVMYCISGSCLVPYETFCKYNNVNVQRDMMPRLTEDALGQDFRRTETDNNRYL